MGHALHADELLLGPGQGHIQDPHFLGLALPGQGRRHGCFGDGVVPDALFPVHPLGAQAQPGVHQHRTAEVVGVEGLVQVRQDHHRELQSLGPVHAHDLHPAAGGPGGDGGLPPLLQQVVELGHKVEQAAPASRRLLTGVGIQGNEVLLPGGSALHGPEHRQGVALRIELPQQAVRRHVPGRQPQLLQQPPEGRRVRAVVQAQGVVIIPLRLQRPDQGQAVRRKAEQRRPQHGDQRHILPGVVDDLQKRHHHRRLRGAEEGLAFPAGAGDVLPAQGRRIGRHPGPGGAHENDDVLRLHRPGPAVLPLHLEFLVQQPPNSCSSTR